MTQRPNPFIVHSSLDSYSKPSFRWLRCWKVLTMGYCSNSRE